MKLGLIILMILGLGAVAAEAADELCIQSFKGCADGSALSYALCQDEGDCSVTLEQAKDDCMKKFPDCADRAYVEDTFTRALSS